MIIKPFKLFTIIFFLFGNSNLLFSDTLTDILEVTFEQNKQLFVERTNLLNRYEQLKQIKAARLPTITANILGNKNWDFENDMEVNSFSADISADYIIYDGNLRDNNIEVARHQLKISEFSLMLNEQRVLLDGIVAYLDVLRNQRLVDLSQKNVSVIEKQLLATESRYSFGELTRTDVAQASAALSAANSTLSAREGALVLSKSVFRLINGIEPTSLSAVVDLPSLPKTIEEARGLAIKFNPSYNAAVANEDMARASLKVSKSIRFPKIRLSSSISDGDNFSAQVRIMGSVPVFTGGKNQSIIKGSSQLLEIAVSRSSLQKLNILQSVVASWSDLEVSQAIIGARLRQVEASTLAYEGVKEEARLGARTTLDVLDAEQALMNAQSDLATAKSDKLSAGFTLLSIIGKLTPDTLGFKSDNKILEKLEP
jgi:outer membrane protein